MKIHSNIPKLQQGGAIPPFVSWSPIPSTPVDTSVADAGSTKSSSSDEGLLSKEMIKLLMENGLPSDVEVFTQSLNSLYSNPVYRMTGQLDTGALSSQYLGMISNLSKIKFNKEQYDNSITRLTANGGLYDLAISSTGGMIVQDLESGQLKQVTPEEYYKNYGNYKTVTNGDLAHLRAVNPNMGFDSSVFGTLNNGIGQKEIQDYINKAITDLKSTTTNSDGYIRVEGEKMVNGLGQIISNPEIRAALAGDGVYKVTQENKSNYEQSLKALSYIYQTLPQNARTYLKAKAATLGLEPEEGVKKVLTDLISSKMESSSKFSVSFDKSATDATVEDSSSRSNELTQNDQLWRGLRSKESAKVFTVNPGTSYQYSVMAVNLPSLMNLDQTSIISTGRLDEVLNNSILGTGDKNSIWFGDKKISADELQRMIYMDDQGVTAAYLPYKEEADGSIKPDIDALLRIQAAEKEISPGATDQEKKDIYKNHGVLEWYGLKENPEALAEAGKVAPFYMINAMAVNSEGLIGSSYDFNNQFVSEVDDNYSNVLKFMNSTINKNTNSKTGKIDMGDGWIFGIAKDHIYEGTLYIAASDPITTQTYLSGVNKNKGLDDYQYMYNRQIKQNSELKQTLQ